MLWKLHRFGSVFFVLLCLFTTSSLSLAGDSVEQAGKVLPFALAATSLGVISLKHDGPGMLQYGKSAALTLGVTYALKHSIQEERPNGKNRSFPSGHTSTSFVSAEFLRKRYGWKYGLPAYVAASFVGYSRVESDNHYWHDVIAGAAIGIGSSYLFSEPYHGVAVALEGSGNYGGIRLGSTW